MPLIRNVRSGSVKLNEDDRLQLGTLLLKAGYAVRIRHQLIPGNARGAKEYVIEYWEDKGNE